MDPKKNMVDIRNKRLSYFSRLLESSNNNNNNNEIHTLTKQQDKEKVVLTNNSMISSLHESLVNKEPFKSNQILPQNNDILEKLFGSFKSSLQESKNLQQSLSFEESSTSTNINRPFLNPKLEEFKRVVEGSYAQHVLNKPDINIKQSKSIDSTNSNRYEDLYSLNNTPRNNLYDSSRVSFNSHSDLIINDLISNEEIKVNDIKNNDNNPNLPCKIPYMSAYNIYEQPSLDTYRKENNNKIVSTNNDTSKKHLSSTGSSLTTSPTSVSSSSAGSIKKLDTNNDMESINELIMNSMKIKNNNIYNSNNTNNIFNLIPTIKQSENEPQESQASSRMTALSNKNLIEAKPPDTPRTDKSANITFRKKNLLMNHNKLSIEQNDNNKDSIQQDTYKNSFEKKNSFDEQIKNQQPSSLNPTVNLYSRSNSINEQMIKDQFIWDNLFNKKSSITSLNSTSKLGKKKLEPINKSTNKSKNSTIDKLFNSNKFSIKKINNNNVNKISNLKRKPNKNNIFSYNEIDHFNYEEDDDDDDDDEDDKCDTLDIFSSEDEEDNSNIKDNVTKPSNANDYINKLDLKIDLGQLSADEDTTLNNKEKMNINEKKDDDESYNLNEIINSCTSRTQQQKKPDNIPNLRLDLMDDDKSLSVAASLAKSMCKEIDYKKEMEMIYKNDDMVVNSVPPNKRFNKNISHFGHYNSHKASSNTNNNQDLSERNTFLKGPKLSSRPTSARNTDTKTLDSDLKPPARPHSSNFFHKPIQNPNQMSIKTSKKTSSGLDLNQNSLKASVSNEKLVTKQSVNILTSSSVININNISIKNNQIDDEVFPPKEKFNKTKKPHWNTSKSMNIRKSFQRPNSAIPLSIKNKKTFTKESTNLNDENVNTNLANNPEENNINKPTLFLNYSRLIEIEKKIKSEIEIEYLNSDNLLNQRAKSANHLTKSTINLKFDLPELNKEEDGTNQNKQNEEKFNFYDSLNLTDKLGDQEAYLKLISSEKHQEKESVQVDWLSLPDEIWLKIFSYLRQVDLMNIGNSCKTFNNIYVDSTLWRSITMKYKYNMKDEWLDWIGKRRPNELNIVQCSGNITLYAITNMFKNIGDELKSLNLSRCSNEYLSGDNFALQASIRCKNVTCLDLSWTLLSNQTLKLIADSFLRIESINLSGCNMIQEDGFNFLLTKHGEFMKNLEISGCLHFSSNSILNIGVYCRGLERLNISNCHRMTNESIVEACPHWLKLKHLDLRGIKSVKNNCVSILVRKCAHLTSLALADCVHIGDTSVLEIATYKPNIKYLDLNGCKKISDNSIRSIANYCSNLEYLNIKGTSITDIGLVILSNAKFINNLIELNLSFLPVSEPVVIKLLGNSCKLKSIHLYGCYNIKHVDELKKSYGVNNNENYLTINI